MFKLSLSSPLPNARRTYFPTICTMQIGPSSGSLNQRFKKKKSMLNPIHLSPNKYKLINCFDCHNFSFFNKNIHKAETSNDQSKTTQNSNKYTTIHCTLPTPFMFTRLPLTLHHCYRMKVHNQMWVDFPINRKVWLSILWLEMTR